MRSATHGFSVLGEKKNLHIESLQMSEVKIKVLFFSESWIEQLENEVLGNITWQRILLKVTNK